MIKISVKNGNVVAFLGDDDLTDEDSDFFHLCFKKGIHWLSNHGKYELVLSETSDIVNEKILNVLSDICNSFKIPLPDEFDELISEVRKTADVERVVRKKEEDDKKRVEEWNEQIKNASRRMSGGCGFCPSLRLIDGKHYCIATERFCEKNPIEEEREFYAKREAQRTGEKCEYYAQPYPCVNCPEMIRGRRALELRTAFFAGKEK